MSAPERIWVDPDEAKYFDGSGANQVAEYVRADLYAALEQERDALKRNARIWGAAHEKAIERSHAEVERLRAIVEMAWAGYGYDQEWDCDCPVCAAIRTRTPHDTEGEEPPVTDMQGRDIPHRDCGPTGKMQSNKGE